MTYYINTRTMILRDASRDTGICLKTLWDQFNDNSTPPWQTVQREPRAFDKCKKDSGKYTGTQFQTIYKKTDYVDWMLGDGEDRCKNSLAMRMLFEYCRARRALEEEEGQEAPPRQRRRIAPSAGAQAAVRMLQ